MRVHGKHREGGLQRKRAGEGKAGRTINYEIGRLRQILKAHGAWGTLSDRVRSIRERQDAGRSISREDEGKLIGAISECRSPAMLPLFILAVDTGLRASEVRALRLRDLGLEWRDGVIVAGRLVVSKSKTDAGTGPRGSAHAASTRRADALVGALPRGRAGQLRLPSPQGRDRREQARAPDLGYSAG